MKKRTTESIHPFIAKLYNSLHAYHIEGLTMDKNREFTAIVEAIQFEKNEELNVFSAFSEEDVLAKWLIANELSVPLYFVCLKMGVFSIFEAIEILRTENGMLSEISLNIVEELNEEEFVSWWAVIKKTTQTHPLNNGASSRAANTIFDEILESHGFAWGGNIDAFIVDSKFENVLCIIDDISIGFVDIENFQADPARFFHKRGPIYNTWLSTVKLANRLNVPHLLLTKNAKDKEKEVVGISVIDHLDLSGIYYVGGETPPQRIIKGINNIKRYIEEVIKVSVPPVF